MYAIRDKLSFLVGKRVTSVDGNTRQNKKLLEGRTLINIRSFGKRLIFEFDEFYLVVHFLMYGRYSINERIENKIERLSLTFDDAVIRLYNTSVKIVEKESLVIDESIDVMSDNFDIEKAKKRILSSPSYICDILLDQSVFAGVGNIIKNEVLFRSRVHPLSMSCRIEEKKIEDIIANTLNFSRIFYVYRKNGKSLKPEFTVYGKKICSSCGSKIVIKHLGNTNRRTYYCERCQILYDK